MVTIDRPDSTKIILLEIDIGREWTCWFNYQAGVWVTNFDAIYSRIDSQFLGVAEGLVVTLIGSVKVNGFNLSAVQNVTSVVSASATRHP